MPILIVAYPLLVHLSALRHDLWLQLAALICLAAIPLYSRLRIGRVGAWLLLLALAGLLYALTFIVGGGQYALFIPPVLLPAALGTVFGESLLPGRTALITRVARASRGGDLPLELAHYTRGVTLVWTLALFALALTSIVLAAFAPLRTWSVFTNFISYLILGALFPLEYLWRRWRYPAFEHPGFWDYLKLVARTNYRKI